MATKRDKKALFPFIKPKGSIKKDIEELRRISQSGAEDGDEVTRDIHQPVQRRESARLSSASKLFKHLKPERHHPAYSSEGKGLRKRRQPWASERELRVESRTGADDSHGTLKTLSNKDRSRSFNEQDRMVQCVPTGPSDKENEAGFSNDKETPKWRFRLRNAVTPNTTAQASPERASPSKNAGLAAAQAYPAAPERVQESVPSHRRKSHSFSSPAHVKASESKPLNKLGGTPGLHEGIYANVIETTPPNLKKEFDGAKPLYSANPRITSSTDAHMNEPAYANLEQLQVSREPDLLQNLPSMHHPLSGQVSPMVSSSTVSTPSRRSSQSNSESESKISGRGRQALALSRSVSMSLTSTTMAIRDTEINPTTVTSPSTLADAGSAFLTNSNGLEYQHSHGQPQPLVNAKSTPSLAQDVGTDHGLSPSGDSDLVLCKSGLDYPPKLSTAQSTPNLDVARSPLSPKPLDLLLGEMHSPQHNSLDSHASWDWERPPPPGDMYSEDEYQYASQLRSSMASVLHGRQSSSLSAGSSASHSRQPSALSTHSDDTFVGQSMCGGDDIGLPSPRARFGSDSSQNTYETFRQDMTLYYKQYSGSGKGGTGGSNGNAWLPMVLEPDQFTLCNNKASSSPPPPPPVRDASSLKYIKYGPGHEKHPSWPMPAAVSQSLQVLSYSSNPSHGDDESNNGIQQSGGQSQRSKSWTEHTDYPKEPPATYVRPYAKQRNNASFSQQLKTVMENCVERIPPEAYQPKDYDSSAFYPTFDCDGRPLCDQEYNAPSPPERDVPSCMSTSDYVKYEDIQQYSHSEGYSSYVPSEASYVSIASSGTPLLDRLRREGEIGPSQDSVLARDTSLPALHNQRAGSTTNNGRESVATVATNSSGSNSSNETLRWHGSYSDISVMSGSSRGMDSRGSLESGASLVVVHSAKVQAPVRHNSESVLYYSTGANSSETIPGNEPRGMNSKENAMRMWASQERKLNEYNHYQQRKQPPPPKLSYQRSCSTSSAITNQGQPRSPTVDTSHQPSVAERIHQLERQSKSVPNLFDKAVFQRPIPPPNRQHDSSGDTTNFHFSQPMMMKITSAVIPSATRYPQPQALKLSPSGTGPADFDSFSSLLNPTPVQSDTNDAKTSISDTNNKHPYVNYTYLDPDKRLKVADPTLKAIQKQALLSYYERHTAGKGGSAASQQSACLDAQVPSHNRDMAAFHQASSGIARLARIPESLAMTTTVVSAPPRQSSPTKIPHDHAPVLQLADSLPSNLPHPEPLPPRKIKNDAPEVVGGPFDRSQPSVDSNTNGSFRPETEIANTPVTRKSSFSKSSAVASAPLPPRDQSLPLVPPERPPKRPHLRAQPPPVISAEHELRRIEASVQELMNLSPARRSAASTAAPATSAATGQVPLRKKPPAPDPPAIIAELQHSSTAQTNPSSANSHSPTSLQSYPWASVDSNANGPAEFSTASSSSQAATVTKGVSPEPSASFAPSFQHPSNVSPTQRSLSPELPLPPPPILLNTSAISMDASDDDSLPPPPSPLDVTLNVTTPTSNSTYHKESYMIHCKSASAQRLLNASPSNVETSVSPGGWERQHNIRSSGTTLVFSSDELKVPEKHEPNQPEANATKLNNLPTLQHTYRSIPYVNSDRFAYLRKVSNGEVVSKPRSPDSDPIITSSTTEVENSINKALSSTTVSSNETFKTNPNEENTTVISTVHLPVADLENKKETPSPLLSSPPSLPVSNGFDTPVISASRGSIRRTKKPEEIECEQLSIELANHLSPSDKLRALLAGPGPHHLTPAHYVEELFSARLASSSLPLERLEDSLKNTHPPLARTTVIAPLPANSLYFTTSEPMAKMLNRYGQDMNEKQNTVVDTQALAKKKEELMARLGRKLEVLRSEKLMLHEEVEANEALGAAVAARVAAVATPLEANKVALHVAEVDKITALLLALAGRLARAQNALQCLPAHADPQEKAILESKRDKLAEQLEEAKLLNDNIEKRSRQVALLLSKYFTNEEFADYDHFVTMKAKLVMDGREIDDKIKLGEEQLAALKETMVVKRS